MRMPEPSHSGEDVALFIDWENFKISLADGHRTPNVSSLKEEVSNYGRVVVAKAYADWVTKAPELRGASQFINDPPSLYAAGIEPVFVPTRAPSASAMFNNGVRTPRIKNSVDVKMTADCIECAHSYPNIGTFVLVSGDADFIHVLNALRTMGKRVIVIGVSWSTSRRLADQADILVLYDVDVDPPHPAEPVVASNGPPPPSVEAAPGRNDLPEIIRAIEDIIRDERHSGNNPLLTSIKQRLTRRYPAFDEKKLGYSGFKKLMARAAQEGNIKLITAGLVDWVIMADEEIPDGATEQLPSAASGRPSRRRGRYSRSRAGSEANGAGEPEANGAGEPEANGAGEPEANGAGEPEANGASEPEAIVASEPEADAAAAEAQDLTNFDEEFSEPSDSLPSPAPVELPPVELPPVELPPAEPPPPFGGNQELAAAVEEALASVPLPDKPEDGHTPERVSDLIVMADTLEHREGVSHVAFNFLVGEICDALQQGLQAEDAGITQRWGETSSKSYISKMLRSLSDGGFFQKGTHTWRDEESGVNKRRRTFNLDRENDLVRQVLQATWGDLAASTPPGPNGAGLETVGMGDNGADEPEPSFISRLFRPLRN